MNPADEKITLVLNTGDHCIETSAKIELERLVAKLLSFPDNDSESGKLEIQFQLLRDFIEQSDFNYLRGSDQALAGIISGVFKLERDENGSVVIKEIINRENSIEKSMEI